MKTTPQTFLKFIAGAAVAAAVLFLVWYFSSIVVYILISAVLAVVGNPLVKRLAALHIKGWKVPRWLAALVTLIVIWVVLATLCSLFVPLVFNKIYQLSNLDFAAVVQSIEEPIAQAQGYLHEFFAVPESTFSLSEALASALKQIIDIESLNSVFSSIVNVVLSSVIAIFSITFITFFFLRDEGLFYAMVTAMFPERYHENITRALDSVKGIDDFVVQPTLYSERVKAHPLEIFLVILIAGSMAGILGMLLAIPSYTVLRVFAKEFFSQFRLVRKLTEKI